MFGLSASFTIELLQMLTFRATDVNDLITNTLGTYLGFLCAHQLLQKRRIEEAGEAWELGIVIAIVFLIMFFAFPFVSSALWDLILT